MKKFFSIIFILSFFVAVVSCSQPAHVDTPVEVKKDAVLVYFASDNNLLDYANDNIKSIENNYRESGARQILVYYDEGAEGRLVRIGNYEGKTKEKHIVIKSYPDNPDSCDPAFLEKVITDAKEYCGVYDVTDIILWSHGKSWMPREVSLATMANEEISVQAESAENNDIAQYSFGMDNSAGKSEIEIDELARVLNKFKFRNIFFDACYMGSIEVAYQLRNAADYIIGSSAEILASGYPYDDITELLIRENIDGVTVAKKYFEHYDSQSGPRRSATISVVDCSKLEPFAEQIKILMDKYAHLINNEEIRKDIRYFDRTSSIKLLYDMKSYFSDIIKRYGTDSELAVFEKSFDELVLYQDHTDMMINQVSLIDTYGVSVYIPYKNAWTDELMQQNEYYLTLDWSSDSGMAAMLNY